MLCWQRRQGERTREGQRKTRSEEWKGKLLQTGGLQRLINLKDMTFLFSSLRENMCARVCLCTLNQYKDIVITARWTRYIMSYHHVRAEEREGVRKGKRENCQNLIFKSWLAQTSPKNMSEIWVYLRIFECVRSCSCTFFGTIVMK